MSSSGFHVEEELLLLFRLHRADSLDDAALTASIRALGCTPGGEYFNALRNRQLDSGIASGLAGTQGQKPQSQSPDSRVRSAEYSAGRDIFAWMKDSTPARPHMRMPSKLHTPRDIVAWRGSQAAAATQMIDSSKNSSGQIDTPVFPRCHGDILAWSDRIPNVDARFRCLWKISADESNKVNSKPSKIILENFARLQSSSLANRDGYLSQSASSWELQRKRGQPLREPWRSEQDLEQLRAAIREDNTRRTEVTGYNKEEASRIDRASQEASIWKKKSRALRLIQQRDLSSIPRGYRNAARIAPFATSENAHDCSPRMRHLIYPGTPSTVYAATELPS